MTTLFTTSSPVADLSSGDPRSSLHTNCLFKFFFFFKKKPSESPKIAHFPLLCCQTGWRWCDRQEDHCRHIRRVGSSRWRRFLRQRLLKGRPFSGLRCPLGGQVAGQSQTVQKSSGSGESSTPSSGPYDAACRRATFEAQTLPSTFSRVTGVLCYWSGPASVHLLVHLRFLQENRDRAAPDCQQELWSAARSHCQVNIINCVLF